jgi:hypothetical protein
MIATMLVHVSSIALALALASVPSPGPTPFPIGTLEPFGAPSPLPEIGRVRSAKPACAVMRDLIIPSFAAARRADARFAQTRTKLPQYAVLIDDPEHRTDIFRESALTRIDSDADALLKETLIINKALGDPRISAESKDPDVMAERKALQQLYDTEKVRANLLTEFVIRQRAAIATNGIDTTDTAFGSRSPLQQPQGPPLTPPPMPDPSMTAPPGMPLMMGNDLADQQQMRQWGNDLSAAVARSENGAAKTFLPIAQGCR